MRHKKKRVLKLSAGPQKQSQVVRNLLTSLVENGQIVTTSKKAKVLKSQGDKFFNKLVTYWDKYDEVAAPREAMRLTKSTLFTDNAGKKAINDLVPKWRDAERTTGFIIDMKLGPRAGDAAEEVLVKLA